MLFDLKGKRRRAVQGTYLTLAILMGAGLVLFGVGSSTSGGLGDLFKGGGGSNKGNSLIENRIKAADKTLALQPRNEAALAQVIRGHYQLATLNSDPNTGAFSKDAQKDLLAAGAAWQRYLNVAKKPDPSLAGLVVQNYVGLAGLTKNQAAQRNYYGGAASAAEVAAAAHPSTQAYLALTQLAAQAGRTREAQLAGNKAVSLAPKAQRKTVQQQVKQYTSGAGAATTPSTGGQGP